MKQKVSLQIMIRRQELVCYLFSVLWAVLQVVVRRLSSVRRNARKKTSSVLNMWSFLSHFLGLNVRTPSKCQGMFSRKNLVILHKKSYVMTIMLIKMKSQSARVSCSLDQHRLALQLFLIACLAVWMTPCSQKCNIQVWSHVASLWLFFGRNFISALMGCWCSIWRELLLMRCTRVIRVMHVKFVHKCYSWWRKLNC